MNALFFELRVVVGARERRLVRRIGEEILIGANSHDDLLIDDPSAPVERARLFWTDNNELNFESAVASEVGGRATESPASLAPEQKLIIGNMVVSWRKLSAEECPTIPGVGPGRRGLRTAAIELTAELSNGRYQRGPEVGRGGMGQILQAVEEAAAWHGSVKGQPT